MGIQRKALDDLERGDHCIVRCAGYWHHGIYIGGGEFMHKTAGTSLAAAVFCKNISVISAGGGVIRTTIEGFTSAKNPTVFVITYESCFSPEDSVELAMSELQSGQGYRLLEANCEHFATYCKTGEKVSFQVITIRNIVQQLVAVSAGVMVGIATMTKMDPFKNIRVEVIEEKKGTFLGLRDRSVTLSTTQVNQRRVLWGASLIGLATVITYKCVRGVERAMGGLIGRMSFSISVVDHSSDYTPPAMKDGQPVVLLRCRRPHSLRKLFLCMANVLQVTEECIHRVLMYSDHHKIYEEVAAVSDLKNHSSLQVELCTTCHTPCAGAALPARAPSTEDASSIDRVFVAA